LLGLHIVSLKITRLVVSGSMRNLFKLFVLALIVTGGTSLAHAQTGHFVFMQQGLVVNSTSTPLSAIQLTFKMGTGFVGTTTGAFLTIAAEYTGDVTDAAVIELRQYDDSSYATQSGACFFGITTAGNNYTNAGFTELVPESCTTGGGLTWTDYVLSVSKYYAVEIVYKAGSAGTLVGDYTGYGIAPPVHSCFVDLSDNCDFEPQFAIVGDGFTLTPTTASSGLNLSGARDFCNAQFGTSTRGIAGIGTDLANGLCQAVGFLFIPSAGSIDQFSEFVPLVQTRFPFAWGFDVKDIFATLATTSSANYPDINYAVGTTTPGPYHDIIGSGLQIANGDSIKRLAPDSTWTTIRYLIGVILWISFAYFIYRKVMGIWHVQT